MTVEDFSISNEKVKFRYRERYVTEANNEKSLAFPRGVYRGFLPRKSAVADMKIWLAIDPRSTGNDEDSFAVYAKRNEGAPDYDGWALSIRETADIALDLNGSALDPIPGGIYYLYIYIDVDYSTSSTTTATYNVSDENPYNIASSNYNLDVILVGRVPVVPAGVTIDFDITNDHVYDDVVSVRKLPISTPVQVETMLGAGNERWGFLDSVRNWRIPTEDEKLAMTNSSSPSSTNPFLTNDNLYNTLGYILDTVTESKYREMISTGIWDESWALSNDSNNIISGGATKEYVELSVFFSSDDSPRLLILDNANCKIEVWNPRTLTSVITTDALSNDLPSGSGQTWETVSFCNDGTYVYVMFVDTNASPRTYQVQAWTISESSSNWSVKIGWSATGTALPGSGTPIMVKPGRIIIANSTKLATSNGWVLINAATSDAISIISKSNGTIDDSAAGDAPTALSAHPELGICSDGTNIFFSARHPGSPFERYICSATIANPQTGCGGSNYPLDIGTNTIYTMCSCGPNMMVSPLKPSSPVATDIVLRTNNSTDADLDNVELGQNSAASPLPGNDFVMHNPQAICFDGLNIWILATINNLTLSRQGVLIKIDASKLSLSNITALRQLTDLVDVFIISPDIVWSGYDWHSVVFDGRDIWLNLDPRASQPESGKIVRLPFAFLRR